MNVRNLRALVALAALYLVSGYGFSAALENGAAQTASLATTSDVDDWTFHAIAGQTIHIQIAEISGTNLEPLIELYSPSDSLLTSNTGTNSADITFLANQTGTYTVYVSDSSNPANGTGTYQLFLALSSGSFQIPDDGGSLISGGKHSGNITLADVDIWTFTANALETVILQVGESADHTGGFQPRLFVYDPFGKEVANNWGNTSTDIRFQSPLTGQYTVIVKEFSSDVPDTGSYDLYFTSTSQSFITPPSDEGGLLTNGGVHSGTITLADIDAWRFTANTNDTVLIQAADSGADGGFQPELTLYDEFGNEVATNSGNEATDLKVQLTHGGNYTVIVRESSSDVPDTGAYALYFTNTRETLTVPPGDEGGLVINGGVYDGEIELADIDTYTFPGKKGETAVIQIGEITDNGGFQPEITLYDPLGNNISSNHGNTAADLAVALPMNGDYSIVVKEHSHDVSDTGTYKLYFNSVTQTILTVPIDDEGGTLTNGTAHDGEIELGDVDAWTFNGGVNQHVRIQITELTDNDGGFQPELKLYDPLGNLLTTDWGNTSAAIDAKLNIKGQYTVIVKEHSTDVPNTGTYRLYFQQLANAFSVPSNDEGGTISSGNSHNGTIEHSDMDGWTLSANAQDKIDLTLTELNDNGGFTPQVTLYDPLGRQVARQQGSTGATVSFTADLNGTYTALVADGSNDAAASGTYQLNYNRTDISTSLPSGPIIDTLSSGELILSTISGSTDTDKFQLNVEAGETVYIRLGEQGSSSTAFVPRLRVFNSSGTLIWSSANNNAWAEALFNAPATETLTIVASNNVVSTSSFNYQLNAAVGSQTAVTIQLDEGGEIATGQLILGNISAGDSDIFNLNVVAGETVYVRVGEHGSSSTAFAPQIRILGASGDLLWSSADNNAWAQALFKAPTSETLTLIVDNHFGSTNVFNYHLTTAVGSQIASVSGGDEGGMITSGQRIVGDIDSGDTDVFNLDVVAGENVYVRFGEQGSSSTAFAPQLHILGANGDLLWSKTDNDAWAEAHFIAPASETLTIIADNHFGSTNTFNYHLTAAIGSQAASVSNEDEGGMITTGLQINGILDSGDSEIFNLNVVAGEVVYVRFGENNSASTAFEPQLRILGANGDLIWASANNNAWAQARFKAPATETLTIIADNHFGSNTAFEYQVTAAAASQTNSISSGDEGGKLKSGELITGNLNAGDAEVFNLDVVSGEAVYVRLGEFLSSSTAFAPQLTILSGSGELLWYSVNGAWAEALFKASATETLTVIASNNVGSNNNFSYQLTSAVASQLVTTSTEDEGGTLEELTTLAGTVNAGDADVFQVNVQTGVPVQFDFSEFGSSSTAMTPTIYLFSSNGALLGYSSAGQTATLNFTPISSEVITVILANGTQSNSQFDYNLVGSGVTSFFPPSPPEATEDVPLPLWALIMLGTVIMWASSHSREKRART